jgi:hypothetical protein
MALESRSLPEIRHMMAHLEQWLGIRPREESRLTADAVSCVGFANRAVYEAHERKNKKVARQLPALCHAVMQCS